MGDLDYYVAIGTVGEVARTVQYVEEVDEWTSETSPELKLQRKLNVQRVEREMVPYLLENDDHFYSALTVEVRPAPDSGPQRPAIEFTAQQSFPGGVEFGVVTLDGSETLCALDGQHRLKSLEIALRQRPQIAREQIGLILIPWRSIVSSQSLFSDLNRYARKPSKSMSLLFTHREPLARVTKRICGSVPILRDRVNMETTTLSTSARQFITLSTLYEMNKLLLAEPADRDLDEDAAFDELTDTWKVIVGSVPQWKMVETEEEHPAYLRPRYLNMHGVGQQAIARAVGAVKSASNGDWRKRASKTLSTIDWQLQNPWWQNIALQGGKVNNTATSIRNLGALLSAQMGIEPAPAQREAIEAAFALQRKELPDFLKKQGKSPAKARR